MKAVDEKLWLPIGFGVLVILGVFVYWFHNQSISDNIADWASFGAYVGGCFGFISVILMYMVFREQSKMAYKTQFEAVFFDMLHTLREIWNPEVESKGLQLCNQISAHFKLEFGSNQSTNDEFKKVMSYYMALHKKDNSLNHYFRYLYHIVKYVTTNDSLNANVKYDYISLIQAQMSNTELMITFFNAIEYNNPKYIEWLDIYGLFENLVTDSNFLDTLKQKYFPKTTFKYIQSAPTDVLEALQQWYDESQIDTDNEQFYDTLARLNKDDK